MKHTIRALLALAALTLALPAPGRAQGDITWGVKGGLNFSGLRGSGDLFDTKRGVALGAFGVLDFAPEFGVEVDALFMMKGAKTKVFGVDPSGTLILRNPGFIILDYLEFPILARLNTPALGRLSPHLYFGPTLALKVSARALSTGFPDSNVDGVRGLDSGLAFGVSGDLPMGARSLVLDARFGLGITSAVGGGWDLKNDAFSVMAGVGF